jgi:prepilin-type N-terminal cleavage/methylation domain-containing protein
VKRSGDLLNARLAGRRAASIVRASAPQSTEREIDRSQNGVTLIEMLIVVAIISLMVGISYPSISSGIDTLRLTSACDSIASFLNGALNRAERKQVVVEVTISKLENVLIMRSEEPGFERRLDVPQGVRITGVIPSIPFDPDAPRHFLMYPGGTVPRFGVELANQRGGRRIVRVDPITGISQVERPEAQ